MMTWAECAAAGMSQREAAEARQVSISAAKMAAKRLGLTFRPVPKKEALNRPEVNPLVLLTPTERADYDLLKRAGHSRNDALRSIGRGDLIR